MGMPINTGAEAGYASQGQIAHPGTAAQITAAQTFAATDIESHVDDQSGSGISVASVTIVAAR